MKLYFKYKRFLSIAILGLFVLMPIVFSYAETAEELQSKISDKDADIAKLEAEIKAYQAELDVIGDQKNSLSKAIKELDITRKKLVADINLTQKKIDKTNIKIAGLTDDIGSKESSISTDSSSIASGLRKTNEYEQGNMLNALLSANDFTVVWNDIDNISTIREEILENVIQLKKVKGELEDTREVTIEAKNELTRLKAKLSDQQKIVVQNTNAKNKLLQQTKNSEANYQKLLKERIAQRDAFEKELRDFEAQLQYILDPTKLPNKGVLSWPLENVYVTQLFGKTADSGRLYASGTHNGVDFRASVGTPVMAMADGKIMGTGDTDLVCSGASFGKFVFIRYNNGLSSTFGHLSLIKSSVGQEVKRGQVVGYTGNTGHSTGPHLHVSLYASEAAKMTTKPSVACGGRIYTLPVAPVNAYLDVLYYLPPYKVNTGTLRNRPNE